MVAKHLGLNSRIRNSPDVKFGGSLSNSSSASAKGGALPAAMQSIERVGLKRTCARLGSIRERMERRSLHYCGVRPGYRQHKRLSNSLSD
jgi:hypothetical protein